MKVLSTVIALSFLFTSCTTLNRSQPNGSIDLGIKTNLQADVDVDMSKQVKGSAHHQRVLWFIPVKSTNRYADGVTYNGAGAGGGFLSGLFGPGMVEETKSAAAYNAVVPNKVDVLVAPQYVVQVKDYVFGLWKDVTVNVTGYAGKIRDIKSVPKK